LGVGALAPIPNPQSPIPNPQSPMRRSIMKIIAYINIYINK
jgi:hypothetical protein